MRVSRQLRSRLFPSTSFAAGALTWALAGYLVDDHQSLVDELLQTAPPIQTWRSTVNPKAIRYYQLSRIMMQNGEESMAEVNLTYAASADTAFPDPLIALAELAEQRGDSRRADSLLDRALTIDSEFTPAFLAKAQIAFWMNDNEMVAAWSEKALHADSTDPLASALSAWATTELDSASTAVDIIERARIMGDLNPFVLYVSAQISERLGDKQYAAKTYRRALELLLKKDD